MKYYRGKYLIGIYAPVEEGETLLGLCDNISEFAELLDISKSDAGMILHSIYTGKHKYIRFCRKLCAVEFIEYKE